jgi:hypothetical protein
MRVKRQKQKKEHSLKEVKLLFIVKAYCDERSILNSPSAEVKERRQRPLKWKAQGGLLFEDLQIQWEGRAESNAGATIHARCSAQALGTSCIVNPACAELQVADYVASHEFDCLRLQNMIKNNNYTKNLIYSMSQ